MRSTFYESEEYRELQRQITKRNFEKGVYDHLKKKEVVRVCVRDGCGIDFSVKPYDPKKFCSRNCSATVANTGRIQTQETRSKISNTTKGRNPVKGIVKGTILVPRVEKICENISCKKLFISERYRNRRYCGVTCSIKATGSRPTSPKASRGKYGIRTDISDSINFHSRWEANIARLYTHLGIEWVYEPKTFDIGGHTYTPDFYLPRYDEYIEVKNFLSHYSKERDMRFRDSYPNQVLKLLLKDEYLALEKWYGKIIPRWEFKNSTTSF